MVVSEVVESLFARAAERIEEHLELEGTPFTLNDHYFAKTREDLLSSFREARRPTAAVGKKYIDWDHVDVTDALSALAACGYPGITADQLPRLLGPDKFEEALDAAAQTVAYWKIAYKVVLLHFSSYQFVADHGLLAWPAAHD